MMMMARSTTARPLTRADPSTIHNKFLVGYQGWFTCAGDGEPVGHGHHGWLHWFNYPVPDGGRPNIDLWPDVSEYTPSELFPAPGLKYPNGERTFLFSSRHPKTVQRHFRWMAMHGVDGAFLQRFAGQCDLESGNEGIRRIRDEIGDSVMEAAEKEGRVFAIMYDVSGVAPDRIQRVLESDWIHLLRRKAVLDSPAYLHEQGRPVVALWGFGMSDAHHSPATVRAVTRFIRENTPGGAYIVAGVPSHWRTSVMDADPNPEFVRVWMDAFDAISPWTVGRYHNEDSADQFEQEQIKGDVEFIEEHNSKWESDRSVGRKIDYMPVIFPGGSGYNLSEGKWQWNDAPRKGGRFLWRQVYNVRRHDVHTIYGAMWDEYDEGTAFMPVVSHKRQLPVHEKYRFMALDEDGFDLPPDWYMRICGFAAESLRGERLVLETFPSKELQDYWSSRPRYDAEAGPSSTGGSGSVDNKEKGQTWEEWEKLVQKNGEEPPPPYSLEAEEPQVNGSNVSPLVLLEQRPSLQAQRPSPAAVSTAPPPINSGSRPQNLSGPSDPFRTSSHLTSPQPPLQLVPIDEFSRLKVSSSVLSSPHVAQAHVSRHSRSSSPRPLPSTPCLEQLHSGYHSHANSPRPTSPADSHTSSHSHTCPAPATLPNSETGFLPEPFPSPSRPPRPWSQAAWPPPEWSSEGPAAIIDDFFHPREELRHEAASEPLEPGYSFSYAPVQQPVAPSPPPHRPRPSAYHHTRPPSSETHDYGFPGVQTGGFAFPEAHVSPAHANEDFHGDWSSCSNLPSPHHVAGPHAALYSAEPSFPHPAAPVPHLHTYGYGSAPIQSVHDNPTHPGAYPSAPASYSPYAPHVHPAHGPPPHASRPPHPPAGYSANTSMAPGGSSSGPLGQALNLVGSVAGPGAKNQLQNLANSGSKLFSKYRK